MAYACAPQNETLCSEQDQHVVIPSAPVLTVLYDPIVEMELLTQLVAAAGKHMVEHAFPVGYCCSKMAETSSWETKDFLGKTT